MPAPADRPRPSPAPAPAPPDRRGWALVGALHVPLLAALFGHVVTSGGREIIGSPRTETWSFLWSHHCMAHSVLIDGRLPYHLELIDFPAGGVLWLKDPFWALLLLPVQLVAGVAAAYTVESLALFALAGGALYGLARELGATRWPAALAALTFSACPHMLGEAYNGNLEAMAIGWMPLWLWAMLRAIRAPGWRSVTAAGAALWLLLLNNPYYAFAMALASPWVAAIALVRARRDTPAAAAAPAAAGPRWPARLAALAAAVALGVALFVPFGLAMTRSMSSPDNLALIAPEGGLHPPFTSDLVHLARPMATLTHGANPPPPFQDLIYPGLLLALTALAAPWLGRRDGWRFAWPALAAGFVVLSLGPVLVVDGRVIGAPGDLVTLPWGWLHPHLGPLQMLTLPHRFASPAGLFLSLGLAWTLTGVEQRLVDGRAPRRAAVLGAIALAALAEILIYPPYAIPLETARMPRSHHGALLGELDAPGAVLNVPVFMGHNPQRIYFAYQAEHGRPIAMAIRAGPPPTIAAEVPLINALIERHGMLAGQLPVSREEPDDPLGVARLGELGYGFVVLHPPFVTIGNEPDAAVWVATLTDALGPGLALDDGTVLFALDDDVRERLPDEARARLPDGAVLGEAAAVYADGDPFPPSFPGMPRRSRPPRDVAGARTPQPGGTEARPAETR